MILAARLLCNMIRILMVRRTTWWVARIWRITELLVVGTMVSKSVLPDITGVVSLPNVAISPYIEIVTISNHLQDVIIEVFSLNSSRLFKF